ncbi:MAG: hypothetical protein ACHQIM_06765 [Sphingobacteriales bacterium]
MKANFITILLCSMLTSLFTVTETNAQVKPFVVAGAPNPPGPVSGPTSVVMPTVSSQYSVPPIVVGITLHWSLSPGTAGTISASVNQATVNWNASFTGAAVCLVLRQTAAGQAR